MAHLLLIDDDPALIPKLVRQVFPGPAHRVEVARTGAEGLERVSAMRPDVLLLDLRLPDQSGLDVYQQIRRIDARIPFIFVTMAKTLGGSGQGASVSRVDAPVFEAYIRERLGANSIDLYAETHRLIDHILLPLVLEHSGGIQSRAAALLGIGRRTLRQRLCELGLTTAHPADQAEEDAD
jgi:DNA-binding NtrC family response regulator